jgi:hypothetical protein
VVVYGAAKILCEMFRILLRKRLIDVARKSLDKLRKSRNGKLGVRRSAAAGLQQAPV